MKYITTYFRTQGEGSPSLVLQQFLYRRVPVCLACMCLSKSKEGQDWAAVFVEEVKEWSDAADWTWIVKKMSRNPEALLTKIKTEIMMKTGCSHMVDLEWTVLVCIDSGFLIFGERTAAYWLMTSYGRGRLERISKYGYGEIEPGAGIILASGQIEVEKEIEAIQNCLCPEGMKEEDKATNRLREFARQVSEPSDDSAMILLLVGK